MSTLSPRPHRATTVESVDVAELTDAIVRDDTPPHRLAATSPRFPVISHHPAEVTDHA